MEQFLSLIGELQCVNQAQSEPWEVLNLGMISIFQKGSGTETWVEFR